jgi:type IV pilus assembly protein PilC
MTTAFAYRVRDPLGKLHEGSLEASSVEVATQQLRQSGFQVLDIEEDEESLGSLFSGRVSRNDVIYVTSQLAIMTDTGINLSAALGTLAEQQDNPRLARVLRELKSAVEGGRDFSDALSEHPQLFDKTYVALVKASEATGLLPEMLDRIATYLRKEVETRGKVRSAMAYPTVMIVLATGVTIFLLTYILPKFTPLFARQGARLPKPTLVMMAVSEHLLQFWPWWIAGTLAALAGLWWGRRTVGGRRWLDWAKINTPIIGPLVRKVTISRSIRTLGTMLSAGVPMLDAIQLSAAVCGNFFYEKLWRDALVQVTAGNRVCEALAPSPLLPRMLVQMISSGEETGKLDKVLAKVSNYYDQEVESSIKATTSLIEPLLITVMGVVVGGIALALLMPIFALSRPAG